MSSPVKLYVYDLSNGLARQLSLQLTGRQIDGIWYVLSVVHGSICKYLLTIRPGLSNTYIGIPLSLSSGRKCFMDRV